MPCSGTQRRGILWYPRLNDLVFADCDLRFDSSELASKLYKEAEELTRSEGSAVKRDQGSVLTRIMKVTVPLSCPLRYETVANRTPPRDR